MINDDINRQLAERVMGWELNQAGCFYLGECGGAVYKNRHDIYDAERMPLWSPTTNVAQALECLSKWCIDNNSDWFLTKHDGDDLVECHLASVALEVAREANTPAEAITQAIIAALDGGKP